MKYIITEEDKAAIIQGDTNYSYRIYITDEKDKVLDVFTDFTISDFSIDGKSNMRRTLSITVNKKYNVTDYINTCLRYNFKFQIGVFSLRKGENIWYECGTLVPIDINTMHDSSNNSISFSLGDGFAKLDGTRNGQLGGAQTIKIQNKDSNDEYVEIKAALINFLKAEGIINYIIDDLGEFYGIQANNPSGYLDYRNNNPLWDKLPYDLEFNCGCTIGDIITEFIELYPNNQAYYDIYNNFCAGMIPSCNHNPIELDNDYLQKILLSDDSENVIYDIKSIKNVTEVFGKIYEIDRYAESCITNDNVYILALKSYDNYSAFQYIAFTPNTTNLTNMKLQINELTEIPIYNEFTTTTVSAGNILKDNMCVIRIMKDLDGNYLAYYLGKFQPHALCVLTDDINDPNYTKAYFEAKYNCTNIILREEKDSPFTVQKLGEIPDIKSDDKFENILSDTVAAENAIYYNQISSSMNETIDIHTLMLPWLDVNCKVSYQKAQGEKVEEYIIDAISHSNETSKITMRKFYPLYFE